MVYHKVLAGVAGIEPAYTESKSVALPLGHTPISAGRSTEKSYRLTEKKIATTILMFFVFD